MVGRVRSRCGSALACTLVVSCSLTHSLDDLSSTAGVGGQAAEPGDGGSAASGGTGNTGNASSWGGTAGVAGAAGSAAAAGAGGAAGSGGGSGGAAGADPPWWDASWPKRARLDVTNPSGDALPSGFELGFGFDPAIFGASVNSWAIARYDGQSWSARAFHVESAGGQTWLWTPLPASLSANASDASLWLYAGKPGAPGGDPTNVFLLWDGFEASSNSFIEQGPTSIGGGDLALGPYGSIRSSMQYSVGHAVDFALAVDEQVQGQYDWISGGFQRTNDFDNVEPWVLWISRAAGSIQTEVNFGGNQETGSVRSLATSQMRIYGVERFASHSVYRRDNAVDQSLSFSPPNTGALQVRLTVQSANAQARLGFVRVRRASDPPPSIGLGPVEDAP